MIRNLHLVCLYTMLSVILIFTACNNQEATAEKSTVPELDLKRGNVVLCGPPDKEFGKVTFATLCSESVKKDFELAVALLHSFEYDEAEKVFAGIIDKEPKCGMAYWGVAMSNYHQVWPTQPTKEELIKGSKAIAIAKSLVDPKTPDYSYIDALSVFYQDWEAVDHKTRSKNYLDAMAKLHSDKPDNAEAAIFYALALLGTADLTDKTYKNQKQAGEILSKLQQSNHPGIVHYIIHSYDYPELASMGLQAARKYASIAPAWAHAQHMPSHIFIRLGYWDESIHSNTVSADAAKCYADSSGVDGHWDEELHAVDYLVYAYLQKGDNQSAKKQVDYLKGMKKIFPVNFKVAYALAASPSRYNLENHLWKEASLLDFNTINFSWQTYPWQKAILHFARLMGEVHAGSLVNAKMELDSLKRMEAMLTAQKDSYKAGQVAIQAKMGEAWILYKEGKQNEALATMHAAVDMEDKTEKSVVTPGEVLPARELYADMLMSLNRPAEALKEYEADLKRHPNRFNGLYGAAVASEKLNDANKATHYYSQLLAIAGKGSRKDELDRARMYMEKGITLR